MKCDRYYRSWTREEWCDPVVIVGSGSLTIEGGPGSVTRTLTRGTKSLIGGKVGCRKELSSVSLREFYIESSVVRKRVLRGHRKVG